MTAAFDAQSALSNQSGDQSFTHTPVAAPRGIAIGLVNISEATDIEAGITYGGITIPRVDRIADATGELLGAYSHFLGSGIPSGAQTVAVDMTSASQWTCWVCSISASGDTRIAGTAGSAHGTQNNDQANPSITLSTLSTYAGFTFAALGSGQNAPASITAGAGCTLLTAQTDFGNTSGVAERSDSKTGANITIAFTSTSEDVAMVALAIEEIPFVKTRSGFTDYADPGWMMKRLRGGWKRQRSGLIVPDRELLRPRIIVPV